MIAHLLISSVAATALVGFWIGNPLESTADTVSDTGDAEPPERTTPVPEVKVALAATAPREEAKPEVARVAPAPVAALAEIAAVQVAMVEVPNVRRLSVWEARKQLKKQGLRFSFKEGSRRIPHEDFDYYKVRKQSLSAGERVAAGTKVTLQVRQRRYASGY